MIQQNKTKILIALVAGLTGLSGHLELFPWLPLAAQHWIELAGFLATIISAVLINPNATPPIPTISELNQKGK